MPKRYILRSTLIPIKDKLLIARRGNFNVSGQSITFRHQERLVADGNNFTLTGQDINLVEQVSAGTVTAETGSFTLTGQSATFSVTGFPTLVEEGITTHQFPTLQSTFSIPLPDRIENGDILILAVAGGKSTSLTLNGPTGWSNMHNTSDSNNRFGIFFKTADGTEDETNVTATFSTNVTGCAQLFHFRPQEGFESTGLAGGTSTSPDPPSLSPSWGAEDTMWLTICMADLSTDFTEAPTGYTNLTSVTSGAGNTCSLGSALRTENTATEDPGAFTISSSQSWEASTNAISPRTPLSLNAETGVFTLTGRSAGLNHDVVSGSQAGDEDALTSLYSAANGDSWTDNTGWQANMTGVLDGGFEPFGITTELINSEYRVTEIELRDNNLTGSIDFPEIGNLKEMTLFSVSFNSLNSAIPSEIGNCSALEYLYLCRSDTPFDKSIQPHVQIENSSLNYVHEGKHKGSENNVFTGPFPSSIDGCQNLKFIVCGFSDSNDTTPDGISSVPSTIWDIPSLEVIYFPGNWNVADHSFPTTISHMTNLKNIVMGTVGYKKYGWLTGPYPTDMDQLTGLYVLEVAYHPGLEGFPDLSNCLDLTVLITQNTQMTSSLPSWVLDGSHTDLDMIQLPFPEPDSNDGFTGNIPEVGSGMGQISSFTVTNHSFSGSIPVSFWEQISGITNTNFGGNNLTSIGKTDLTALSNIRNLRWYDNEIKGEPLPTLDWANSTTKLDNLTRVFVERNRYVPRDIVPEYQNYVDVVETQNGGTFRLGNQKPFGNESDFDENSGVIDFSARVSHADNTYTWYKDGTEITGETSRSIDTDSYGAGDYHLDVDNSSAPKMGTTSSTIITVS